MALNGAFLKLVHHRRRHCVDGQMQALINRRRRGAML